MPFARSDTPQVLLIKFPNRLYVATNVFGKLTLLPQAERLRLNDAGPKLIIVCGLPGSGKTTLAKELESKMRAVRFCTDEWIDDLLIDHYDEQKRGKVEKLQWKIAQQLLACGLMVIIEWGT